MMSWCDTTFHTAHQPLLDCRQHLNTANTALRSHCRYGNKIQIAGNHLLVLSNLVEGPELRPSTPLGALGWEMAGALPPYHPGTLKALIAKGRVVPACRMVGANA